MKNFKYLIGIIIIGIIAFIGIEFLKKDEKMDNKINTNNIQNEIEKNNITENKIIEENNVEKTEIKDGEELLEKADKVLVARGWAGASNNVIGLKDEILYYYNKETGEFRKIATGIKDIYYKTDNSEEITAKQKQNFKKTGEDLEFLIYE